MDTKQYRTAFAKFRADLAAAVAFTDGDLTNTAITRRRHDGVMSARTELLKQIPAAPTAPSVSRSTVIAALMPRTADRWRWVSTSSGSSSVCSAASPSRL